MILYYDYDDNDIDNDKNNNDNNSDRQEKLRFYNSRKSSKIT